MSQINSLGKGFQTGAASVIGPQMELLLAQGQQVQLQISGDSMRPTLKPRRDSVLLSQMCDWPPKRGDILLFRSKRAASGYALHRVVRMTPEGPIMNGDAQIWVEGPIAREAVLARADVLIRKGKPISAKNALYRLRVRLWSLTRPARRHLFACYRAVKRVIK